jgi:hypothetical protein
MRVQLHEGRLCVRDGQGATLYAEQQAQAEADAGVVFALPDGMVALDYDANARIVRHFDARGNCYPMEGEVQHPQGEAVLAALDAMVAAKLVRDTPPPPSQPTAEQLAEQAARAARMQALLVEALADEFIDRLRSATPDQIKTYVQNNVTDLPSAKVFLAKLGCAVAFCLAGGRGT